MENRGSKNGRCRTAERDYIADPIQRCRRFELFGYDGFLYWLNAFSDLPFTMSDSDPLDLSARDLMQGWVNDLESPQNFVEKKYRDYEDRGGDQRGGGKGKGRGGFGGGGAGGGNRGGFNDRDKGRGGQGGRGGSGGGGGQGGRGGPGGKGGKPWEDKRGGGRDDRRSNGPPRDPAPQFTVAVEPSQETVEALAKHIRTTGRAYSMVDVARMVMASRDRYQVAFQNQVPAPPKKKKAPQKGADAANPEAAQEQQQETPPQQKAEQERPMLVRCKLDGSLWLTREEAVRHVLSGPLMEEFYQVEVVEVEAPKGNFTVIAVCGMSGTMLGPPNHHEYQTNLNKLYRERFSNMGFERFKSRIEMKRDEETVEAWKSSVSTAKHYRIKPPEAKKEDGDATAATESETAPPADVDADAAVDAATTDAAADTAAAPDALAGEVEAASESEDAAVSEADTPTEADAEPTVENETESSEGAVEGVSEESDAETSDDQPTPEADVKPEVVISSERELEQHFRENFAKRILREVGGGVVPGDVPGQNLSAPLLEKLKRESEFMRRGFPLPLIQTLCRRFEKVGLKFFKRDKKALYVSSARPRSISGESGMTDRIRQIVEHVRVYPNVKVPKLLESVIDGFIAPRNEEEMAGHKPTDEEMSYLRDIRWLTKEGYLIEYATGELVLGHAEPNRERPAKKKSASPKTEADSKAKKAESPPEVGKIESAEAAAPAPEAPVAEAETEAAPEVPSEPESEAPAADASEEAPAPSSPAVEDADAEKPTEN